jgi:hypothetical protein
LQILSGFCARPGLVTVEVSEGNIGDPPTLASQVAKLKGRFAAVAARSARLEDTIEPAGLGWITTLRGAGHSQSGRGGPPSTSAQVAPATGGVRRYFNIAPAGQWITLRSSALR